MPEWDSQIEVDEGLAKVLIGEQFPSLDAGSLRRVGEGWDNTVWATGEDIAFRFPRRSIALPGIEREIAILPELARRLPPRCPTPPTSGRPAPRFRGRAFGSRLIQGTEIADAGLPADHRIWLAGDLAAFLARLHAALRQVTSLWSGGCLHGAWPGGVVEVYALAYRSEALS